MDYTAWMFVIQGLRVFFRYFLNALSLAILLLITTTSVAVLLPLTKNMTRKKGHKTFLVTGCDSGFGFSTTQRLALEGHTVFAGCLTPDGVKRMAEAAPTAIAFLLDVTNDESIARAEQMIAQQCENGLDGLVNNAGIFLGFMIEWGETSDYRRLMDVNFHGLVKTTTALLPHIKKAKGTVVNITSTAGVLVMPMMTAYSCSKYAAEAFSDGLRRELAPFGVKVSVIEPVVMKTPIINFTQTFERAWEKCPQTMKDIYGDEFYENFKTQLKVLEDHAENPVMVVNAVEEALMAKNPKRRQLVGKITQTFFAKAPSWVVDAIVQRVYMRGITQPKPQAHHL